MLNRVILQPMAEISFPVSLVNATETRPPLAGDSCSSNRTEFCYTSKYSLVLAPNRTYLPQLHVHRIISPSGMNVWPKKIGHLGAFWSTAVNYS